jgi:SRSO17 transposase
MDLRRYPVSGRFRAGLDHRIEHGDGHAFLLLRRHRYTGTVSYFLCWSPAPVPLAELISAAVARWRTEEDHQQAKQVSGLDSG